MHTCIIYLCIHRYMHVYIYIYCIYMYIVYIFSYIDMEEKCEFKKYTKCVLCVISLKLFDEASAVY